MKQYKLIKEYPGLPNGWKLGCIVGLINDLYVNIKDSPTSTGLSRFQLQIENYYEFWQEVEEVKVGDWVKRINFNKYNIEVGDLFKIKDLIVGGNCFDNTGSVHDLENITKATNKEIVDHLTKEAEKRGYKIGQSIEPLWIISNDKWKIRGMSESSYNSEFTFTSYNLTIYDVFYYKGQAIYCNGNWAKIIEQEPKLTFGGKTVELHKIEDFISIRCEGVVGTYEELKDIYKALQPNPRYTFGTKLVEKVTFSDDKSWVYGECKDKPETVQIGCTTGKFDELKVIIEACRKLINN